MNKSTTVPPATLRNALPDRPLKNRATKSVWIFCATAHGISQIKKKYCRGNVYWPPPIELTFKLVSGKAAAKGIHTSDRGLKIRGPMPRPRT